jgi:hypothetical protein
VMSTNVAAIAAYAGALVLVLGCLRWILRH